MKCNTDVKFINTGAWDKYAPSYMRSSLIWDITQRRMGIPYRRFGTNYRSHLQLIKHFILGLLDHRALI